MKVKVLEVKKSYKYEDCYIATIEQQPKFNPATKQMVPSSSFICCMFKPEPNNTYEVEFEKIEVPNVGERAFFKLVKGDK